MGTCKKVHQEANRVLYRVVKFTCYIDHEERKASTGMLDAVPLSLRLDLITCLHIDIGMNWAAAEPIAKKYGPALFDWSALRHFTSLNLLQVQILDEAFSDLGLDKWDVKQRTWLQYPLVVPTAPLKLLPRT